MTGAGRPTGPAGGTTEVVLSAALQLLLAEGVTSLTAQRLHQLTGVSRSTIYRHWPTPTTVLSALIDVASAPFSEPTGDMVADTHRAVDEMCDRLRDKPVTAFLQALASAAAVDPEAVDLRHRYLRDLVTPVHRAMSAGGLPDALAQDAVPGIVAPLLVDAALLGRPVDRERAHRTVDRYVTASPGPAS